MPAVSLRVRCVNFEVIVGVVQEEVPDSTRVNPRRSSGLVPPVVESFVKMNRRTRWGVQEGTGKVQGRYREGTGKVQGRYREGTGNGRGGACRKVPRCAMACSYPRTVCCVHPAAEGLVINELHWAVTRLRRFALQRRPGELKPHLPY